MIVTLTSVGDPGVERPGRFEGLQKGFGISAILLSLPDRGLHPSCDDLALHCSLVLRRGSTGWKGRHLVVHTGNSADVCHFLGRRTRNRFRR